MHTEGHGENSIKMNPRVGILLPGNIIFASMISILRATTEDHRTIAELGRIAVELAHRESAPEQTLKEYMDGHYSYDAIKEELSDPANIYHIISYHGKPAGFSKIVLDSDHPNINRKNATKLDRIYLLPEFFGMKLGYELLQFNIEYSKANGQSGIWLFTWVGNERAVKFYLRAGFKIVGSHLFKVTEKHYNENHHMLMELED
jgi:ribosomal protein S18 acetylase RimI-like enzyme